MNISLTPELEKIVAERLASGRYASASDVIAEALRLLAGQDSLNQPSQEFQSEQPERVRDRETSAEAQIEKPVLAKDLLDALRRSGFIGMWKDRRDIGDSIDFAGRLREDAERRGRNS